MTYSLSLLTILHLLVDGVCGATLAVYALSEPRMAPIIYYFGLYTLIAFGGQGLAGWCLDMRPRWLRPALALAAVLLALGSIANLGITLQAVLLGVGNCLFHVAGGSYVLRAYNTYAQLGLFVCSGAIGLGLGLNSIVSVPIFVVATLFFTALLLWQMHSMPELSISQNVSLPQADASKLTLFSCALVLFLCIVLRGFGSGALNSELVMLLPCTLAVGKLLGGLVCDRIGYKKTILLIFLLGFVALQLQGLAPTLAFVLVCNMTMPLTLRLVHWYKPQYPGLMFGLAASCLVPGALYKELLNLPVGAILVLQFLSLAFAGYYLLRNKEAKHADP